MRDLRGTASKSNPDRLDEQDLQAYQKAVADFRAGRPDEALRFLKGLIKRRPAASQAYHLAGVVALAGGDLNEARGDFRSAIRFSDSPEETAASWTGLGRVELSEGNLDQALACFDRAEQLHPRFAPAQSGQAAVWCDFGDYARAESLARAALMHGDDPRTKLILARCLLFQSRMDESEELLRELVSRPETGFLARVHLAGIAYARGRAEEAGNSFRRLLREQPLYPCYVELAKTKTFVDEDDPDIANMRLMLDRAPEGAGRTSALLRADLSFALAKAYDDLGRPDAAFPYLRAANSLRAGEDPFDIEAFGRRAEITGGMAQGLPASEFNDGLEDAGASPLLIAALPRSGSSLLEQMLSGHSAIRAGGEFSSILPVLEDAVNRVSGKAPGPGAAEAARFAEFRTAKRKMAETLRGEETRIAFVTEKSPMAFLYAGLVAPLLPRARVVHLRRHPLDTALSQYMQSFARGLGWSYDLDAIADYHLVYERTMERWRRSLGPQILEVRYEALVCDPGRQLRRILEFCGLDFEPACERFEGRARPVWTASGFQIRQPLTAGSVGKWRRYGKYLAPLERRLADSVSTYEEALRREGIPYGHA